MNFIHIADLHCNRERKESCLTAIRELIAFVSSHNCPKVFICGDFWDSNISNSEQSGFVEYIAAMKQLASITEVFMIYGTPTHEVAGSLDIFQTLGVKVFDKKTVYEDANFRLIIIPEPRKSDYITTENTCKVIKDDIIKFCKELEPSDKETIVLYHGDVDGALLQNGMSVNESPDNYAIPPKVLKELNADYYAFGHIHEPQKIEVIGEAYYIGSTVPKDFGEHHKPRFNYVNIKNHKVTVNEVYLPFPQNITKSIKFDELDKLKQSDYSGKRVKVEIEIEKLFKKNYSLDTLEQEIKDATNAEFVKVVFNYSKVTNVRSKEITSQTDIIEKFKSYAKLNDINTSDSVISKLKDIKDSMINETLVPSDSFELEYIHLRGAIGIKDGIGKDEYEVDFTKYDGLLLLTAPNGSGKSTLIENCHPYPQMLTRIGSLKDHFFLKDSHRILIYRTSSGKKIRITMKIDGCAKCIMNEFLVETKDPDSDWIPVKSCSGGSEVYKNWVEQTFGSLDIFLRTSFYANGQMKSIPDLSIATKGQKMSLFSVLAGTDYLTAISDIAKEKVKEEKDTIKDIKGELVGFEDIKDRIEQYKNDIVEKTNKIEENSQYLEIDKKELEIYTEEQKKYEVAMASVDIIHRELVKNNNELADVQKNYDALCISIGELKNRLTDIEDYKKQLKWVEENTEERKRLIRQKSDISKDYDDIKLKYTIAESKGHDIELKINSLQKEIDRLNLEVNHNSKGVVTELEVCPYCGQEIGKDKQHDLQKEQEELQALLKTLADSVKEKESELKECESKYYELHIPELKEQLTDLDNRLYVINNEIDEIDSYMSEIDVYEIKEILNNTEPLIESKSKEKQSLELKIASIKNTIGELEEKQKNMPVDYSDKVNRLKRGINETLENISELKAEVKVLKDNITSLSSYEDKVKEIKSRIKEHEKNATEYDVIATAFGNNGIQALELDSAAPEISDITNSILADSYGTRFTVSFDTQRDSSNGSKKIDDFIINVFDSEKGRMKRLDLLSTGESIWIKQALYLAFSVIRSRRTGFCFRTRFLDEADGSLDSKARGLYIKMIEAAHKACNATLTVLITHSAEIKEVVQQRIELI